MLLFQVKIYKKYLKIVNGFIILNNGLSLNLNLIKKVVLLLISIKTVTQIIKSIKIVQMIITIKIIRIQLKGHKTIQIVLHKKIKSKNRMNKNLEILIQRIH